MVHFAIADARGNSVAVEYMHNEMKVIQTSVLTNIYLGEGDKKGIVSLPDFRRRSATGGNRQIHDQRSGTALCR